MNETIGYLVLSSRADTAIRVTAIVTGFTIFCFIMALPVVIEIVAAKARRIFFTTLGIASFVSVVVSLIVSWVYQSKAIEACAKDPSCDYVIANKEARKITDLGITANTQQ